MNERTDERAEAGGRSRRLTGRQWLTIFVVTMLLLFVAVRGAIAWRYSAEVSVWAEAGMPLDMGALWEERTAGEAGAVDVYREAFDRYERSRQEWVIRTSLAPGTGSGAFSEGEQPLALDAPQSLGLLPYDGGPIAPEALRVIEKLLDAHRRSIALAHDAAAAGGATRLPRTREEFEAAILPYMGGPHNLLILLGYEAGLHARGGDVEAAVVSLEAASYLPALLRNELYWFEHGVHDSVAQDWANAVEYVLTQQALDAALLDRVAEAAERAAPRERLRARLLWAEAATTLAHWQDYVNQEEFADAVSRQSGWRQANQTVYLSAMRAAGPILEMGDEPALLAAMRQSMEVMPAWADEARVANTLPGIALGSRYRANARMRALRAGVAGYRFYLDEGRLPADLEELTPAWLDAVPTDPFTGDPLKYGVTDYGFVVYSVNEDLVDDGGEPGEGRREGDIGFRVFVHEE